MKVFISWSKDRSRMAAEALRDWLPGVLHEVEPWMSKSDISAGSRWSADMGWQLETTDFGII